MWGVMARYNTSHGKAENSNIDFQVYCPPDELTQGGPLFGDIEGIRKKDKKVDSNSVAGGFSSWMSRLCKYKFQLCFPVHSFHENAQYFLVRGKQSAGQMEHFWNAWGNRRLLSFDGEVRRRRLGTQVCRTAQLPICAAAYCIGRRRKTPKWVGAVSSGLFW